MDMKRFGILLAILSSLAVLPGLTSDMVSGNYVLDIAQTAEYLQKYLKKLDGDKKKAGELSLALVQRMNYKLSLHSNGDAVAEISVSGLAKSKSSQTNIMKGHWQIKGNAVSLTMAGKNAQAPGLLEKICTVHGDSLRCPDEKFYLVFRKL